MEPQNPTSPTPPPQPTAPSVSPIFPKKNNLVVILLSILLLITLLISGYLFLQVQSLTKQLAQSQIQVQPTPLVSPKPSAEAEDPTANWKIYKNNYWKISFKYPDTMFKPCPNYTTEKEGIRFWGPQFGCPDGHDILYKIGFVGYGPDKYIEPKKPSSTETITINGKEAQKKTYIYNESDGPLSSLKQSVEVVFSLSNGTVVLQQLGDNISEQKVFDQILSTFKFTN